MARARIIACVLLVLILACGDGVPAVPATPAHSIFDSNQTAFGFFPSPPEANLKSVLNMYKELGKHADVILLQQNIPWQDFSEGADIKSEKITDITNQYILAAQNNLEVIFVVDPLNGLNRREFMGLPPGWKANFGNPDIRTAFTNYTLRIVRDFHPRYLGLASEINTYLDAYPDDFPNYLSLYTTVYGLIKKEAPDTKVFVTFQWEDLNNLIPSAAEGRNAYTTNWEMVEAFNPNLDLWVISTYPFIVFENGSDIPQDYYAPLLERTSKPLAVAEGGFTTQDIGPFKGDPQDQVEYLKAIHSQIGERLIFWIYLLLSDFNIESYASMMRDQGQGNDDIETLSLFGSVGLSDFSGVPKPALEIWDGYREGDR